MKQNLKHVILLLALIAFIAAACLFFAQPL